MAIDKAIPYPILYRLLCGGRVERVAAYKRPDADSSGKWLTETYFETDWKDATAPVMPLPVALKLKALYEQMLLSHIDLPPRSGEKLAVLVSRVRMIRKCRRDLAALAAKMNSEKQFNQKVEFNAQAREIQERLQVLTVHC